jgi:hypothetical protein
VHRSAATLRTTLTDDATAITRAGYAARRLDDYMASLLGTGILREFKPKPIGSTALRQPRVTLSHSCAETKIRQCRIPLLLMNGGKPVVGGRSSRRSSQQGHIRIYAGQNSPADAALPHKNNREPEGDQQ